MRGRPSQKKESLLKIYRFLRAWIDCDDIAKLKELYPGFKERDEDSTDIDILAGIECLVDTMSAISPPDYENRVPI